MLKAKSVDFFAHRSGIADRAVAEREIVLTYALDLLRETGRLDRFAFKGGTCIRKVYLGTTGRFSMDLDFTARECMDAEDAILDLAQNVFCRSHFGVEFSLDLDRDSWRIAHGGLSYTVQVGYRHEWNDAGGFDLQVSSRELPTLDVEARPQMPQLYFADLEFQPGDVWCLTEHEVLAEKVRAAYQRTRVRDLHDLYVFSERPFNAALLRRLVVIKLWQAHDTFSGDGFLERLEAGLYDWEDLRRLVRRTEKIDGSRIIRKCVARYEFLRDLEEDEQELAADGKAHRRTRLWEQLSAACRRSES